MRLALVTEIPAPFRIPLWNALADRLDLRVLFLSERDPRRAYDLHADEWRFDSRVLPGRSLLTRGRWLVFNRRLRAELRQFRPDALLIGGWNQPAFLQAARSGVPYAVWVESTARDERRRNLDWLKRRLLSSAAGALVPGTAAREYVLGLGVDPDRIAVAPNAFDLTAFTEAVERARGRHGPTVLTVARLSPEKDVATLLRAVKGLDAELVVVGDGPQEVALREAAPPNARFAGRAGRDELPRWYANADVFALASRSETWGMSLSQAAAAGLPLVATEAVGGAWDLIESGVNGYRVPVGDEDALREALSQVLADEDWRAAAGRRSRELAEQATPERWAEIVEAFFTRLIA
jgi:glycosyltransferase involved in cell wall biosynthesis